VTGFILTIKQPNKMKTKYSTLRASLATSTILALLTSGLNAAVVICFEQVGNNVIASTSGSFTVPDASDQVTGLSYSRNQISSGPDRFGYTGSPTGLFNDVYQNGFHTTSGLNFNPDPNSATGDTFYYSQNNVAVSRSAAAGSIYTPNTTWTWNNNTLAGIGLGSLTTAEEVVYTSAGGDTISFVSKVPEPSSTLLLGLGGLGLILRRKRLS